MAEVRGMALAGVLVIGGVLAGSAAITVGMGRTPGTELPPTSTSEASREPVTEEVVSSTTLPAIGSEISDTPAPWFRDGAPRVEEIPDLLPFGSADGRVVGYITKEDLLSPRTSGTIPLYDLGGEQVGYVGEDGLAVQFRD